MDVGRAMLIPRQDDEVITMVSAYLHRNLTVGLFCQDFQAQVSAHMRYVSTL